MQTVHITLLRGGNTLCSGQLKSSACSAPAPTQGRGAPGSWWQSCPWAPRAEAVPGRHAKPPQHQSRRPPALHCDEQTPSQASENQPRFWGSFVPAKCSHHITRAQHFLTSLLYITDACRQSHHMQKSIRPHSTKQPFLTPFPCFADLVFQVTGWPVTPALRPTPMCSAPGCFASNERPTDSVPQMRRAGKLCAIFMQFMTKYFCSSNLENEGTISSRR